MCRIPLIRYVIPACDWRCLTRSLFWRKFGGARSRVEFGVLGLRSWGSTGPPRLCRSGRRSRILVSRYCKRVALRINWSRRSRWTFVCGSESTDKHSRWLVQSQFLNLLSKGTKIPNSFDYGVHLWNYVFWIIKKQIRYVWFWGLLWCSMSGGVLMCAFYSEDINKW